MSALVRLEDLHNQQELTVMETLEDIGLAQVSIRIIQPAGADRHGDPGGYRPRPGQYKHNYFIMSALVRLEDLHNQRELTVMETLEDIDLAQVSINIIISFCLPWSAWRICTTSRS